MTLPFSRRLRPLALVTAVFFVNLTSRVVLAPLMPAVEADLGIGHAQAGSLFLMLSLGYCVGLLGAGFVNARLTHRSTIALSSVVLGGVVLGLAAAGNLGILRVGIFFQGLVAGLYLSSGVATITSLVTPTDWGKALAFHELAPNLGFMAAPLAAEALLRVFSWRGALGMFGLVSAAAGVAFLVFGEGGRFKGEPPNWRTVAVLASNRDFWILLVLFALALGAAFGVYSMLPLYLTAGLGLERGFSNTLVAVSRLSGVLTVFASGWLADRLGSRRALMVTMATACGTTVLLGAVPREWIVPAVVLQPIAGAWVFPAAFAALSALNPLAVSFAVPIAMALGGGLAPVVIGSLGERGAFGAGFVLMGLLAGCGALLATRLGKTPAPRGA